MLASPVARVYAEALFDLARGRSVVEDTALELEQFRSLVHGEPGIERFLVSPVIEPAAKVAHLKTALSGRMSDLVTDFLCLVV
jgi:F-type H+-transporting ATPase subunit delta